MTRQYIIAAIIGLIIITSLGIGGFPPAIAVALNRNTRRSPGRRRAPARATRLRRARCRW
jgi:hypothetical protein